ncbi:hypothetical protein GCM10007858_61290 [Bradyrhizobium liaoningense]|nr:hypothetical protein GCM10007858_61290 [Bradyrhizobium liaoningense]
MTEPGDTATNASKAQEIKAGLVRLLSARIRDISDDPRQMRDVVYELARIKLLEQFTHADAREARELQQVLERAIREVERAFERSERSSPTKDAAGPWRILHRRTSPFPRLFRRRLPWRHRPFR